MRPILITGSEGVVGSALRRGLTALNRSTCGLDIRALGADYGDVKDRAAVNAAVADCGGIVHLAAVSRVVWGEDNPELCRATNTGGTRHVIDAALGAAERPWMVFVSSREVYGDPSVLPATEDAPLQPMNVYGRSKAAGEQMMREAAAEGLRASIVRLSNVYGAVDDHHDRVVPAFVTAALLGQTLRVDGSDHTFDFTHIDDTVAGLLSLIALLDDSAPGVSPPPIHFTTGQPTSLGELARLAIALGDPAATMAEAPPRTYDVCRFYGDPTRARQLLDWRPQVRLRDGLERLMAAHRAKAANRPDEQG